MSLFSALVGGAVVGVRHAVEADHVAAVATLVDEESRPGFVGASWGIGHSLPIIALGLLFVVVGVEVPASFARFFEALVGVVLVYLGLRMLADVVGLEIHSHDHGDDHSHGDRSPDRAADGDHGPHAHARFGGLSLARSHYHVDDAGFLMGVLHGFAGSGALVVLLVSTAPSVSQAVAFLAAFSGLSIVTMAGVSALWDRSLGTDFEDYLAAAAGLVGVLVGAALLAETVLGVAPPF